MKLKTIPEDFIVKENIKITLQDSGDYTYFILKKTNWDTVRALTEISKICRVSRTRFNFAGSKDRAAITEQVICAWKVPAETLEKINLKDIEIKVLGRGNEKINLGDLKSNEFTITVRNLESNSIDTNIVSNGFPNYFDSQRFGTAESNHLIGKAIFKGDLEGAVKILLTHRSSRESPDAASAKDFALKHWGDWANILNEFPNFLGIEKSVLNWLIKVPTDYGGALRVIHKKIRTMFVHSYQSYLFNIGLSAYIQSKYKYRIINLIGSDLAVPLNLMDDDCEFDLPNPEYIFTNDPYSKAIEKQLEKDGMSLDLLKSTRMPELSVSPATRKAFVKPLSIKVLETAEDNLNVGKQKVILNFELPKGVYATMLLRCLF